MAVELYPHQIDALSRMKNGCILNGGVGTGKSRTALSYYYICQGGKLNPLEPMTKDKKLYIITTARKRDELEWEGELIPFCLDSKDIVIDSWNNIKKYIEVNDSFFIFDEQRVVGSGAWVKAFYKITKKNDWILLTATAGDTWIDYIPVFVANGFYKNKTQFIEEHVIYDWRNKNYPRIDRYINTGRLLRLRNRILVKMEFEKKTIPNHIDLYCDYDSKSYRDVFRNRWNYIKDKPIENASELCYEARRIVNSDQSRIEAVWNIATDKSKAIIFYNFDYELELLHEKFDNTYFDVAEWNGHKHQPVPDTQYWVYFVQYNAGAEAWNCITTDCIIFYSQNYSYKMMVQASGRIDRLNTPFTELYYYHLKSRSGIDLAISKALSSKKKFNETKFVCEI